MHIEFLVEDSSGAKLMDLLIPQIIGPYGESHTWRLHSFRGIGRIPMGMTAKSNPSKRILLDQLPRLLRGYRNTPGIDAVVVILDVDKRDCSSFLQELKELADTSSSLPNTLFRLAIEEMEAWYLGDRNALLHAYPNAKRDVLDRYAQDSQCDTWELLADAIHPGGSAKVKKTGWPLPGQIKHEWAERIGPFISLQDNTSPSFHKLVEGLKRLASEPA